MEASEVLGEDLAQQFLQICPWKVSRITPPAAPSLTFFLGQEPHQAAESTEPC